MWAREGDEAPAYRPRRVSPSLTVQHPRLPSGDARAAPGRAFARRFGPARFAPSDRPGAHRVAPARPQGGPVPGRLCITAARPSPPLERTSVTRIIRPAGILDRHGICAPAQTDTRHEQVPQPGRYSAGPAGGEGVTEALKLARVAVALKLQGVAAVRSHVTAAARGPRSRGVLWVPLRYTPLAQMITPSASNATINAT